MKGLARPVVEEGKDPFRPEIVDRSRGSTVNKSYAARVQKILGATNFAVEFPRLFTGTACSFLHRTGGSGVVRMTSEQPSR